MMIVRTGDDAVVDGPAGASSAPAADGAEAVDVPAKDYGGGLDRTADL